MKRRYAEEWEVFMLPYADMVVYDTSGQIVLIAEVKSRTEKSSGEICSLMAWSLQVDSC